MRPRFEERGSGGRRKYVPARQFDRAFRDPRAGGDPHGRHRANLQHNPSGVKRLRAREAHGVRNPRRLSRRGADSRFSKTVAGSDHHGLNRLRLVRRPHGRDPEPGVALGPSKVEEEHLVLAVMNDLAQLILQVGQLHRVQQALEDRELKMLAEIAQNLEGPAQALRIPDIIGHHVSAPQAFTS